MRSYVLTVTLNPAIDKISRIERFTAGAQYREKGHRCVAGGKGINVSRALAALGIRTVATGPVGGPAGELFRRVLSAERIAHHLIPIDGQTRTNLTIIDPSRGIHTRILEQGPRITSRELTRFFTAFERLLGQCSYVVLSGSIAPGVPASVPAELTKRAKRKGVRVILDCAPGAYARALKEGPFMIKPNLAEAEEIMGCPLPSPASRLSALRSLHTRGRGCLVCITNGKKGALLFDGIRVFTAVPPRIKETLTVGCGDAFTAGFIAGLVHQNSLEEALRHATACGSANATGTIPGKLRLRVMRKLATRVCVYTTGDATTRRKNPFQET